MALRCKWPRAMCASQVAMCMCTSLFKDTTDVQLWLSLVWDGIHKGKAEALEWNALRRLSWLVGGWAMLLQVSLSWEESTKEWLDKEGEDEERGKGDRVRRRWDGVPRWLHPGERYFSNCFPQNTEMWRQFRKPRTHLLTRLASSTLDTAPTCSPA